MAQVHADWRTAPVRPQVKAALGFIEKLVQPGSPVTAEDAAAVMAAGVSREGLIRAVHITVAFTMIAKIADTFGWALPPQDDYDATAKSLLKRGYVL